MKSYPVSIRWNHSFGFRAGEWASIIGVSVVEPDNLEPRLCYSVMYQDGAHDSIPVSDSDNYEVRASKVTPTTIEARLTIKTDYAEIAQGIKDCTEALRAWGCLTIEQEKEVIEKINTLKARMT